MASEAFDSEAPRWGIWSAGLAGLYLLAWWIGLDRTLIPDEIRPLLVSARGWPELFDFARQDIVQTPLSYAFHKIWLDLFGRTDGVAKASALLISLPTIVLFTGFCAGVTRHWRAASLLLALSFFRVGGSSTLLRMYGLAILFAVVALWAFERLRREPRGKWLAMWAAAMVLLLYTHASGILLLGAFVVIAFLFLPRPLPVLAAAIVVGLSLVPWLVYVYPVFAERGLDANVAALKMSPHRALAELPFFALSTADPGGGSPLPPLHASFWHEYLEPAARFLHVGIFLVALPALWRTRRDRSPEAAWLWMSGLVYALPILVLYLFSVFVTPGISARYFLIETPAWALFLVLATSNSGRLGRALLLLVVFPWAVLDVGLTAQAHLSRRTVGDVAERVAAGLGQGELVVCNKHMPLGWQFHWEWAQRLGRTEKIAIINLPMEPWLTSIVPGVEWEDIALTGIRRIWYVHENLKRREIAEREMAKRGWSVARELLDGSPGLLLFEPNASDGTGG